MSSNQPIENHDEHEHLGTSWEIAIVVVFSCLVAALIGALVFQIRRKRKEKQRKAEQQKLDIERGERTTPRGSRTRGKKRVKHPASTHSRDSEKRCESCACHSGGTVKEPKSDVEAAAEAESIQELTKPPPAAQSERHGRTSYHEYIAKHPPKYYWDQR